MSNIVKHVLRGRVIGLGDELVSNQPSKMPRENIQREIADMADDEVAYTLPWAIQVDTNMDTYIRGDYPAFSSRERNGLRIERQGDTILVNRRDIAGEKYNPSSVNHAIRFWRAMPVILR